MLQPRIRTFSYHYRCKYGETVGKIPLDLGFPCPNRLKGGCIFCRPGGFAPAYLKTKNSLLQQIDRGKKFLLKNRFRKYLAYFQQETATALPVVRLLPKLSIILEDNNCLGLILSTRPDCLPQPLLDQLASVVERSGKECLIELGLQSIHERSLQLLNRNHSYTDFADAVARIKQAEVFELGVHLIFGIPEETEEDMLATIETVCALKIQALKFHHLQVVSNTRLHQMYKEGRISLFSEDDYLQFLLRALPLIPPEITIHRLWATTHPGMLVAPKWHKLTSVLSQTLLTRMEELDIRQGQKCSVNPLIDQPLCRPKAEQTCFREVE
jgi:uncharacterized protein